MADFQVRRIKVEYGIGRKHIQVVHGIIFIIGIWDDRGAVSRRRHSVLLGWWRTVGSNCESRKVGEKRG